MRLAILLGLAACATAPEDRRIRFARGGFEVRLHPRSIEVLPAGGRLLEAVFGLRVEEAGPAAPPVAGSWAIEGSSLRFEPRYPVTAGVAYRAVFDGTRLPAECASADRVRLARVFHVPKPERAPASHVTGVFPSGDVLPENLLRFYVHFSAPVTQGVAYEHARLLDGRGDPVAHPFLEIGEELWDPSGTRLTLLLDPGRIKRGLAPRRRFGPALRSGQRYTLVIDRAWPDVHDVPLVSTFRKSFRIVAPDRTQPKLNTWTLRLPPPETREPLTVEFPEALDHALLQRMVWVTHAGREVDGRVRVSEGERRWTFVPDSAWRSGEHRLVADTALEDRAGNSIRSPFEVDVFVAGSGRLEAKTLSRPFRIR